MGWVSCLEDTQESLDEILNTIQGLSPEKVSISNELFRTHQTLQALQNQLVDIVTDPKNHSEVEWNELRESLKQAQLEKHCLQAQLLQEKSQYLEGRKEVEEIRRQLAQMAMALKAERDIAEHLTAQCYKEQQSRERAESELQSLKRVHQDGNGSKQKKHSKRK